MDGHVVPLVGLGAVRVEHGVVHDAHVGPRVQAVAEEAVSDRTLLPPGGM